MTPDEIEAARKLAREAKLCVACDDVGLYISVHHPNPADPSGRWPCAVCCERRALVSAVERLADEVEKDRACGRADGLHDRAPI